VSETEPEFHDRLEVLSRVELPRPLYKYMRPEHADGLVERGEIRIGTLDAYRRWEDASRGDPHEGIVTFTEEQSPLSYGQDLSAFARSMLPTAGTPNVYAARNSFQRTEVYPNCAVLCTSCELSAAAAEPYAACVEIADPEPFFNALTVALSRHLRRTLVGMCGRVMYASRELGGAQWGRVKLAFVKDAKRFEREKEFRGVWVPEQGERIDFSQPHYDLKVPDLRGLLRRVDIP
jgi:hypothetical protein